MDAVNVEESCGTSTTRDSSEFLRDTMLVQNNNLDTGGTIEAYKKITELSSDEILDLQFDTMKEASEFYYNYAKSHGFVSRCDDVLYGSNGEIVMRQHVCNREGTRKEKNSHDVDPSREPKAITRIKCPAKIRFRMDYTTRKWKVVSFIEVHNHELTPDEHVHLIPAYRKLSDADKAQVNSLHLYGVRTCHIMGLMLGQKGGYEDLGFIKKDLYNHIDKEKRIRIQDGDAFEVLAYLQAKADNDPMFFSKFTISDDGRLQHLFWADGDSRLDYECFGDVVAFDTTYKKNKYNKPLVIFCGYNHHGETTIFASAVIDDEKIDTYTWVLQTLREAMSLRI